MHTDEWRLRTLSTTVRTLSLVLMIIAIGSAPMVLLSDDWLRLQAQSMVAGLPVEAIVLTDKVRLVTMVSVLPGVTIVVLCLYQTWRLFGHFHQGRFFEATALRDFRRFALAVLVMALYAPIQEALLSVALTSGAAPGHRMLIVGFGAKNAMDILLGAALLAIAMVMNHAAAVKEENQAFV